MDICIQLFGWIGSTSNLLKGAWTYISPLCSQKCQANELVDKFTIEIANLLYLN